MKQFLHEFVWFGCKQAYACLFGGVLLVLILTTKWVWQPEWAVARYDFLLAAALLVQALLVWLKLETLEEVKVIFLFHLVGTAMEIFKTEMGSWQYPEQNVLRVMGVPLFSGFMYSAVGSYIARVWRIFDFRFSHYPPKAATVVLCILVYVNFFAHHYLYDIRYLLFGACLVIYGRSWVYYRPVHVHRRMPLLVGFALVSFFIWIAENVGTFGAIWYYPTQQAGWHIVPLAKMGSWFLLMIISFVLVTLLHPIKAPPAAR